MRRLRQGPFSIKKNIKKILLIAVIAIAILVSLNDLTISHLESARYWFNVILIAGNFVVWLGVFLEKKSFSETVQDWGWSLLIAGLAVETACAAGLWQIDSIISRQQRAEIARLGASFDGLHDFVNSKVEDAQRETSRIEEIISRQKSDADAAIEDLNRNREKLNLARDEALSSAAKAEEALKSVTKVQADLSAELTTVEETKAEIIALKKPRTLTDEQIKNAIEKLKPFGKTSFDLSASHDPEPLELTKLLGAVLRKAGWEWQPRNTLGAVHGPDIPEIGESFDKGLLVEVCKSDVLKFDASFTALRTALSLGSIPITGGYFEDEDAKDKQEPCGMMHIHIGPKP